MHPSRMTTYSLSSKWMLSVKQPAFRSVILLLILTTIYVTNYKYSAQTSVYSNLTSDRNLNSSVGKDYLIRAETDLQDTCTDISTNDAYSVTSINYTKIQLDTNHESASTNVYVFIDIFDQRNRSKSFGHDVIVAWAEQTNGDGRVSGHVVDNANGSYSCIFKIFWTGHTLIYAKLLAPIDNTCILMRAMHRYGNIAFSVREPHGIRAMFGNGSHIEHTQCGPNSFIYTSNELCNYTFLNDGMPFFCGQPINKHFCCSDVIYFSQGPFRYKYVRPEDKVQYREKNVFRQSVSLNITSNSGRNTTSLCKNRSPLLSWTEPVPKAFWLNGNWNFVNCYSRLKHTPTEYRSCLRNKTLVFFGDSTVGQYANYFVQEVLNRPLLTLPNDTFAIRTYENHGIKLIHMRHEMPYHYSYVSKHLLSVPHKIDLMRTDRTVMESSLIVLVHYHAHFTQFPPSEYRDRIKLLADAIVRLLEAKPDTKVMLKGANAFMKKDKWFDAYSSLLFKRILEREFENILDRVIYLDTLDISVAHNNDDLHPKDNAFQSEIQQLMTYIC